MNILTLFSSTAINMSVIAIYPKIGISNIQTYKPVQDSLPVSFQLFCMVLSFISFSIHVLFLPLFYSCLNYQNMFFFMFLSKLSDFTSSFALLASSLFLAASSLSARASFFFRSIVCLLLTS